MNLRVDLILPVEQRSASVVNLKRMGRVFAIAIPAAIILAIAAQLMTLSALKSRASTLEAKISESSPKSQKARDLSAQFQTNRAILNEISSWKRARLEWSAQVEGLIRETPVNIEYQSLRVDQTMQLVKDKTPARQFTLTVRARALGPPADSSVETFKDRLLTAPAFTGLTVSVDVPTFGADMTPGADKSNRVFQVTCQYKERLFQ